MDLTQSIPVSIIVQTKIKQQGQVEEFNFEISGQIVQIGTTFYIRYKEAQEDGREVPVTVKVYPDGKVQLSRNGDVRTRLRFGYQEKLETSYRTIYGMFLLTTYAKNLHFSLRDRPVSGEVSVDYDLFSMGEQIGEYQFILKFTA